MLIAVVAMFLQQTCGSVGRVLPAVLAPLIILELHADPSWVGVYFGLTAIAALIGQLGSGGFIIRHGAIRMSQVALLSTGGGMALAIIGGAAGFVLSALVGNGIAAVATPASSQLLGRWAIRRYAPFAFSVTQTAIPAGILLGGWLGPSLAQSLGWRGTMLVSAAACCCFALLLQPLHGRLDTEPVPTHAIHLSDFVTTITGVLAGAGVARAVLCLFRVQRPTGRLHRLLRHLPHRARLRPRGRRGIVLHGHRHRHSVPHPVGLGRQLLCRATLRDVLAGLRDGSERRC